MYLKAGQASRIVEAAQVYGILSREAALTARFCPSLTE